MHSNRKRNRKFGPLHAVVAAAVMALLVMPLAIAGAAPTASTSKVTDAKFKKLKQRIAALEAQGPSTPSGPAGGDLDGQYPNPLIGQNAVGSEEVVDDSLTQVDIGNNAVGAGEIVTSSVGTDQLAGNAVGNSALKPVISRVSSGAESDNTFVEQTATCGAGEVMLGGGYAWTKDASIDMVASAPGGAPGAENNSWFVRGRSGANDNGLFAWVTCLPL